MTGLTAIIAAMAAFAAAAQGSDALAPPGAAAIDHTFTGRVVDACGHQPVANATATVASDPLPHPTGGDGTFTISGLQPDVYSVSVSAAGYQPVGGSESGAAPPAVFVISPGTVRVMLEIPMQPKGAAC